MSVIKAAIYQSEARDDAPSDKLDRLERRLSGAGAGAFDLMLCPELFLSGYDVGEKIQRVAEASDGPSLQRLSEMAARHETALAVGYPERRGERLYNAVAVFGKTGERLLDYRKRSLPPGFEGNVFTAGSEPGLFTFMGRRIAVLICYDVEFPELVREAALAGADVILAPTALRAKWTFVARKMIPTRAFENGVFLLYANHAGREGESDYLGESVIVAPDGRTLAVAGRGEEVIADSLDPAATAKARETLPYLDVVKNRDGKTGDTGR